MALDRITLSDFRNHARSRLDGAARFNLLVGENGAGKTNILEAISLLAPGRGLRRAALPEIGRNGAPGGFTVGASLTPADGGEPVQLGTTVDPARPGRRRVRINAAEASAVSLGEWLAVGWLTPAMDGIFMGAAGDRRRFVDRMALALDPAHAHNATRYEAALRERNRLLADEREPEAAWLDGVESHLGRYGSALAQGRARLVEALSATLADHPDEPFARPLLAIETASPSNEASLREALRANRRQDRRAGRTLVGPHRDDFSVTMAGKQAPAATCSTGEQKAMLIAITLAHGALAAQGRPSILLLDEVAAHLDPLRREALFERLRETGAQVWMTGTELSPFTAIEGEAAVWRVSGGELERLS
ncbi:DNA replication/repair protein RecF [Erythrobacter sp. SDW2]|uniref:DNA replication/repair protein RecF n=1 Tax=Erythrobacter sp. SDW2 TaxID=2907154 RepID=UPI001F23D10B|nr:DNA replication/repair protein RecF [Erythrobacter sp. SDW2]UIP07908.1 DNA replication/repair protein RecF [Erythrobacter sp. SDW2]